MLVLDVKDATCTLDDNPSFKTRLCRCDQCFTLSEISLKSHPWLSLGMFATIVEQINRHVDHVVVLLSYVGDAGNTSLVDAGTPLCATAVVTQGVLVIYFGSAASWRPSNVVWPHQGPVSLS